jgi:hypothetical protein
VEVFYWQGIDRRRERRKQNSFCSTISRGRARGIARIDGEEEREMGDDEVSRNHRNTRTTEERVVKIQKGEGIYPHLLLPLIQTGVIEFNFKEISEEAEGKEEGVRFLEDLGSSFTGLEISFSLKFPSFPVFSFSRFSHFLGFLGIVNTTLVTALLSGNITRIIYLHYLKKLENA